MKILPNLLLICLMSLFSSAITYADDFKNLQPNIFYVNIPVETATDSWQVSAKYLLPRTDTPQQFPAVIILHSTSGIDSTGQFYAKALNKAGIATLELDLWGARGLMGGSGNRPASPQETLPDVFSALHYLAQREEIDADKIGIMGFSWGGVLSMFTATEQYMSMTGSPLRFAGHVAHYPICWLYNNSNIPGSEFSNLTAPILIQSGELDDYDTPSTCPLMVKSLAKEDAELITINMFKRAYHAWDRLEPKWIVTDPFAHLGQGGEVTLSPNRRIAKKSKRNVVAFFSEIFELNQNNIYQNQYIEYKNNDIEK
jgi:dienelactone hydrolase